MLSGVMSEAVPMDEAEEIDEGKKKKKDKKQPNQPDLQSYFDKSRNELTKFDPYMIQEKKTRKAGHDIHYEDGTRKNIELHKHLQGLAEADEIEAQEILKAHKTEKNDNRDQNYDLYLYNMRQLTARRDNE